MTPEKAHTPLTGGAAGTVIDCDSCAVRGDACGDCVVAVLLGAPPELQADEQRALGVLAEAGLVPPLRLVEAAAAECDRDHTECD
jgi:hypothetical protein